MSTRRHITSCVLASALAVWATTTSGATPTLVAAPNPELAPIYGAAAEEPATTAADTSFGSDVSFASDAAEAVASAPPPPPPECVCSVGGHQGDPYVLGEDCVQTVCVKDNLCKEWTIEAIEITELGRPHENKGTVTGPAMQFKVDGVRQTVIVDPSLCAW